MYISQSASISYQDFDSASLQVVTEQSKLFEPVYKERINPMQLRRMSQILRMGVFCGLKANNPELEAEGILVGTGLGCIHDTLGFLRETVENDEKTLSPTAFIQSTHNSIAGQIALLIKNNSYNFTYTQQSLSFESALLDAELQFLTGNKKRLLVGAVDEITPELLELLKGLAKEYGANLPLAGQGAAFFSLHGEKETKAIAKINSVKTAISGSLNDFLEKENIQSQEYDLVLNGTTLNLPNAVDYKKYCGEYFTSTAFALELALKLMHGKIQGHSSPKKVLILNSLLGKHGVIEVEAVG